MSRLKTLAVTTALLALPAPAQVRTDGSLGPRQTLAGPAVTIDAALGRRAGPNLFHSFARFDVPANTSATFTGPPAIRNVLARVTSGAPSNIDGRLAVDIPGANLYLLNPAGVIFGPGATLDVTGSFAVTTADSIRLGTTGRFDAARTTAPGPLTAAAPAAFGFLAPRQSRIQVRGSELAVNPGRALTLAANGNVRLDAAQISAPAGRVNLLAAASAGEFALDPADLRSPATSTLAAYADVRVTGGGIDTTGSFGGPIVVRARDLALKNAIVESSTAGARPGRTVDVALTGTLSLDSSTIIVNTAGLAPGGALDVRAAAFEMSHGAGVAAATAGAARGADQGDRI